MRNATIIPNGRDDTYDTSEVSRKSIEQMFDTAFNADQKKVLLAMFSQDGSGGGGDSGGSGCDCGFECTETRTLLTEENVTTVQDGDFAYVDLSYSQLIDADIIRVTFNGTEYICSNVTEEDGGVYGAVDGWSVYPFLLESDSTPFGINTSLTTETAGTYSVKIEVVEEAITTTPCFEKAINSCGVIIPTDSQNGTRSFLEVSVALAEGESARKVQYPTIFADIEDISNKYWILRKGEESIERILIGEVPPKSTMLYRGDSTAGHFLDEPIKGWIVGTHLSDSSTMLILPTSAKVECGK